MRVYRYRTVLALLYGAALAGALSTPLQAGLILNGGFESGLSNWTVGRSIGQRRNILRTNGNIHA